MSTEKSSTEKSTAHDCGFTELECAEADATGRNVGAIAAENRFGFVRALRPVAKPKAPPAGPRSAA